MAISIVWDNENKTVLRIDFEGRWDWSAYDAAIDEAYAIIRQMDYKVNVISQMSLDMAFPQGLPLRHLQRTQKLMPGNVGYFMVVGGNWAARAVLLAFRHYNDEKIHAVESLEQARTMLQENRILPKSYFRADHILL
jgi:hypothetical protein